MKLRIKGNSVRLRLTQPEVARLRDGGIVEESTDFGSSQLLVYRVRAASGAGALQAEFREGVIEVLIPGDAAKAWADSDEVEIQAQSGPLQLLIEKDFKCLDRPDSEQPGAYPRPAGHGRRPS